ncbi:MAG: hypothetical protein P8N43_02005 [Alphaproteobacteria bacterium]|nr:hypothetical protein [Alphaproteobacteria bacterium]
MRALASPIPVRESQDELDGFDGNAGHRDCWRHSLAAVQLANTSAGHFFAAPIRVVECQAKLGRPSAARHHEEQGRQQS